MSSMCQIISGSLCKQTNIRDDRMLVVKKVVEQNCHKSCMLKSATKICTAKQVDGDNDMKGTRMRNAKSFVDFFQ